MSRPDSNLILQKLPIGIIPLGATNSFANKWFMKLGLDQTDETNLCSKRIASMQCRMFQLDLSLKQTLTLIATNTFGNSNIT